MKKGRNRSVASLRSAKSDNQLKEEIYVPPLDELTVKVTSLQVADASTTNYAIQVSFFDQLLFSETIEAIGPRAPVTRKTLASGVMSYDPSDYEKMCLFADCPLVVSIQPMKNTEIGNSNATLQTASLKQSLESSNKSNINGNTVEDVSCCNVDILSIFINGKEMHVIKRMEPMVKPPVLQMKSWDNLPLLTMELTVNRNSLNSHHHEILKKANYMKLSLIAACNIKVPQDQEFNCMATSKIPLKNETNTGVINYNQGYEITKRLNLLKFYPKWENLRAGYHRFTEGDEKFECNLEDILNPDNIDLNLYLSEKRRSNVIVWGSFHRTLMLEQTEAWLTDHLRRYSWPFEVNIYEEQNGLSFMAFLTLFHLLYPGENTVRIAVPLLWINAQKMQEACGCGLLMNDNLTVTTANNPTAKLPKDTASIHNSTDSDTTLHSTGADENNAFIIVEVTLARPLKKAVIPKSVTSAEINEMLQRWEDRPTKRECTGRGQLDRDWQYTVRNAEITLRRIPYYGMIDFTVFNRQLSETRTRIELMTSFCLEGSVYVNNNFVVQEFLHSNETYAEMLMMSHACLVRVACNALVGAGGRQESDTTLKAARHARHMQDISHAQELYLQVVTQRPRSGNSWRELSTCLLDVDRDWAKVCINKAVVLNPRHPLSLIAKGSVLYEDDPEAAEPFFLALMAIHPFWYTGWLIAHAYFLKRELFHMADEILQQIRKGRDENLIEDIGIPRAWESELGDWWDSPMLPDTNPFYEAADLLLRLRAFSLAETCLSQAMVETGETAVSCHLLALCCRLRGDVDDALCHLQRAIAIFGDLSYLRALQAECYHVKKDIAAAMTSFDKAGSNLCAYSLLLSMPCWEVERARSLLLDLIRRQPSAYAWIALAEDWMKRSTTSDKGDANATEEQSTARGFAAACAVQALKCDRQAARAWALLSQLAEPRARRERCRKTAQKLKYTFNEKSPAEPRQSCHLLGRALRECRCLMCQHLKF